MGPEADQIDSPARFFSRLPGHQLKLEDGVLGLALSKAKDCNVLFGIPLHDFHEQPPECGVLHIVQLLAEAFQLLGIALFAVRDVRNGSIPESSRSGCRKHPDLVVWP